MKHAVATRTLPQPIRGTGRSPAVENLATLSSHITRITDGVKEQAWDKTHISGFLSDVTNAQLMNLLAQMEFRCGETNQQGETTFTHPEVSGDSRIVFPDNLTSQLATATVISQAAQAIHNLGQARYDVYEHDKIDSREALRTAAAAFSQAAPAVMPQLA